MKVALRLFVCLLAIVPVSMNAFAQNTLRVSGPATVTGGGPAVLYSACWVTPASTPNCETQIGVGGVTWSVDKTDLMTIDASTGAAVPLKAGSVVVSAMDPNSGTKGTATVQVATALSLTSISVPDVSLTVGQTKTLAITGTYGSGATTMNSPIPVTSASFSIPAATTQVASVNAAGVVTGVAASATPVKLTISVASAPAVTVNVSVKAAPTPTSSVAVVGVLADQTKTLYVTATIGHNISVFQAPVGSASCTGVDTTGTLLPIAVSTTVNSPTWTVAAPAAPVVGPPYAVNLAAPLRAGNVVCVVDYGLPATPLSPPVWSPVVTVGPATALGVTPDPPPTLVQKATPGATTLTVLGTSGESLTIFAYDPGYSPSQGCAVTTDPTDVSKRVALQIVTSGTSTPVTTSTSFPMPTAEPVVVTLSQPLLMGSTLCLQETLTGSNPIPSLASYPVLDPGDYGRFRTYFVAGVQASNQLTNSTTSANSSSSGGEYLEAGFLSSWVRAKSRKETGKHTSPGLTTDVDLRLGAIPVSAPQTTTTTGASTNTSTATTSTIPNALSSQQSLRVVGTIYSPWKTTNWNHRSDYFTVAPLVSGGFGTLLNPGSNATSATGTASTQTTTSNFSSAYYFWAFGGRFAWDRYSADTQKAPQMMVQTTFTLGEYSSLPSYVCQLGAVPATTVTTACGSGNYAAYGTLSRTNRPRIDVQAIAKLPNYPFVMGLDANLQQYTIFKKDRIDFSNKPGNDIRVYVGLMIDLGSLVTKLGGTGN